MPKLSICIPTFNRAEELRALLRTIPSTPSVEVVICDDGSHDHTESVVCSFQDQLEIRYAFQENAGRAKALLSAIQSATGEYILLMDSDDEFTADGVHRILNTLEQEPLYPAFVFGVRILHRNTRTDNVPPGVEANFISLRADHGVNRDMKEVVRADILKASLYEVPATTRRAPTYLLWSSVAEKVPCKGIRSVVAIKRYLAGGLTDRILQHKTRDSLPMTTLYCRLAESRTYRSRRYRWYARILWARYALHAARRDLFDKWWKVMAVAPGCLLYATDRMRLFFHSKP